MILSLIPLLAPLNQVRLEALDLSQWRQGYSRPQVARSIAGTPLRVAGQDFAYGVGSHGPALARYALGGRGSRIEGAVGITLGQGGSCAFSLWGDGRLLWSSGLRRGGQPTVPFSIDLADIQELVLAVSDGQDGGGSDHAAWLDVRLSYAGAMPRPLPPMKTLTLQPDRTRQTIDNFAASDSWTVEPLIGWPETRRKEISRLLFDRDRGIGLSGWRTNLGGGINHETITTPFRTVDTYDAGEGKFDFTRCPGQRWMLEAAKTYGVGRMVAYSITPPRRMTVNGFTNCTDGQGSTNLKTGQEEAYARYLVGIVEHFRNQGYPITHLSPINEPDHEWNGVPQASSQEGNRASNADVLRITAAISKELKVRKLPVRMLTPEASSPQIGYQENAGMGKKYGSPYGDYAGMMRGNPDWMKAVDPVYAYHSYWSDGLGNMAEIRRKLREALDRVPGVETWMTEYCQLSGPRNEGGWGRDLGMGLALNLARLVNLDLTLVEATAWQWWLAVSDADYKDGLIYVDDIDQPDGQVYASKSLWALGHYSRFVRPGFVRIETEGPFDDVSATLASAFRDPKSGRVVAVFVNPDTRSDSVDLRLPGRWSRKAWITSDRPGHDLSPYRIGASGKSFVVPSRSIVTVVLDPARG